MRIYLDLETRYLVTSNVFKSRVDSISFKRGDYEPLEIAFVNGSTFYQPATALDLRFGIKESGKYDGNFLTYEDTFSWVSALSVYRGYPSFNTTELNTILGYLSGGDTSDDVASVTTMGEITWSDDGGSTWESSRSFSVVVENDVIRGTEGTVTEGNPVYPDPQYVAVTNEDNSFTTGQTILGALTATNISLSGTAFALRSSNDNTTIGLTNPETVIPNSSIVVGINAGGDSAATDSIFIGTNSGNSTIDCTTVIGIGINAGSSGSSIGGSVCIGSNAGFSTNTCDSAVFIGSNSGAGVIGSLNCVAIGYNAGEGSQYSDNTISIGRDSGKSTVQASDSIFIGVSSGNLNQGSNNTFVGAYTSPTNTSVSNAIALGYGAAPIASNLLALGSEVVPLSVIPGTTLTNSVSGLKVQINGVIYTIPLI